MDFVFSSLHHVCPPSQIGTRYYCFLLCSAFIMIPQPMC